MDPGEAGAPNRESAGEAAASRVQGIIEAAEQTAAQIVSDAKAQAQRIREEALRASEEHLAAVEEATARLRSSVRPADLDGARLIALNMALNGESREQADRYLAEHFELAERTKLIEEVYAAVEG